ncbi:hypothetical protein KJ865_13830, partial [Myxococcota bacterium]|nr:hypothetical protein [Myxococcota bacterium]
MRHPILLTLTLIALLGCGNKKGGGTAPKGAASSNKASTPSLPKKVAVKRDPAHLKALRTKLTTLYMALHKKSNVAIEKLLDKHLGKLSPINYTETGQSHAVLLKNKKGQPVGLLFSFKAGYFPEDKGMPKENEEEGDESKEPPEGYQEYKFWNSWVVTILPATVASSAKLAVTRFYPAMKDTPRGLSLSTWDEETHLINIKMYVDEQKEFEEGCSDCSDNTGAADRYVGNEVSLLVLRKGRLFPLATIKDQKLLKHSHGTTLKERYFKWVSVPREGHPLLYIEDRAIDEHKEPGDADDKLGRTVLKAACGLYRIKFVSTDTASKNLEEVSEG